MESGRDIAYFALLQDRLYEVFTFVSCHTDNFNTYSIQMESLLVDACSFFDSLCQSFIREQHANGHTFSASTKITKYYAKIRGNEHFNFGDYRCLIEADHTVSSHELIVNAYEDNLLANPVFPQPDNPSSFKMKPFDGWNTSSPSPWWQAFTGLKHDRISSYRNATLENVLYSLGAAYILLCLKHESVIKDGQVSFEFYRLFHPLFWELHGRVMPGIPRWK